MIAVAERVEMPGFGPWSIKDGIPHVRAPASVLARMVTVRLHLDDCGPGNGPLEVVPGSHAQGFLDQDAIDSWLASGRRLVCPAGAGDAVLMRPLVLHGSRKSEPPSHRRVAHFEFARDRLPDPLRWRTEAGQDRRHWRRGTTRSRPPARLLAVLAPTRQVRLAEQPEVLPAQDLTG